MSEQMPARTSMPIPALMILVNAAHSTFFTLMCASNHAHDQALWFSGNTPDQIEIFISQHKGHVLT